MYLRSVVYDTCYCNHIHNIIHQVILSSNILLPFHFSSSPFPPSLLIHTTVVHIHMSRNSLWELEFQP